MEPHLVDRRVEVMEVAQGHLHASGVDVSTMLPINRSKSDHEEFESQLCR